MSKYLSLKLDLSLVLPIFCQNVKKTAIFPPCKNSWAAQTSTKTTLF